MTNNGEVYCGNHGTVDAVSVCAVCGKPVCGDCAVTIEGITFCNERSHAEMYDGCLLLGRSGTMFDAELIAKNLEVHHIRCHWFGPVAGGETAVFNLFVPKEKHSEAVALVQSLDLMDFITIGRHVR
jgi:hypothetical protein